MAAPSNITLFESFREYLGDGTFDMNSNTFKLSLHNSTYVPSASTQTVYANLTNELATANGYTVGGITLANISWVRAGGTVTFDADDVTVSASGGALTWRTCVLRAVGTLNGRVDPLLGYFLLDSAPADVTVASGNSAVVVWNASGILTLS